MRDARARRTGSLAEERKRKRKRKPPPGEKWFFVFPRLAPVVRLVSSNASEPYLGRVLHDDAQLRALRDEALEVLHHVLAVHLGQNAALVDGRLLLGPPRPELHLLDHERASLREVALSRDGVHHPERALTELALHLEVLHARRVRARGHHLAHAHARRGLGLQRGVRQHRHHVRAVRQARETPPRLYRHSSESDRGAQRVLRSAPRADETRGTGRRASRDGRTGNLFANLSSRGPAVRLELCADDVAIARKR